MYKNFFKLANGYTGRKELIMNKRIIYVLTLIDTSGSMTPYQTDVYNSINELLDTLESKNSTSEDVEYRVALAFFNDDVNEYAVAPMKPEMLKVMIDEKLFECNGCTNLTAAVNFIDNQFSRSSEFFTHKHTGDPKSFTLVITDMMGTDNNTDRSNALKLLKSNRFYSQANNTLVIFTGSDDTKQDAAILAGGEENVIALNGHIADLLPVVAIESTITMTDATHTQHDEEGEPTEPTNAELAQKILDRDKEGADSGKNIAQSSADIDAELQKLLQEV